MTRRRRRSVAGLGRGCWEGSRDLQAAMCPGLHRRTCTDTAGPIGGVPPLQRPPVKRGRAQGSAMAPGLLWSEGIRTAAAGAAKRHPRAGLPCSCICCSFCHSFRNCYTFLSKLSKLHNSGAPAAAASATAAATAAAAPPASGTAVAAALPPLWAVSRRCSRMPVATLTFRLSTRMCRPGLSSICSQEEARGKGAARMRGEEAQHAASA